MSNYAGVIVNNEAKSVDMIFTYIVPEELKDKIKVGQYISVPFGKSHLNGFILELSENIDEQKFKLKQIYKIENEKPILSKESIELVKFMRKQYLCTYIEGIRLLIPTGILKGIKEKEIKIICFEKDLDDTVNKLNINRWAKIVEFIKKNNEIYTKAKLVSEFGISSNSISTLIKHGFLIEKKQKVKRYENKQYECYEEHNLNEDQLKVCQNVMAGVEKEYLLHGITGSGKTEVYMKISSEYLKQGKDVIMLVPEISLTPQMVERFKGRFGSQIAIFHSMLGDGERFDEWQRVYNGEVKIAVGVRSAIFLPFKNIGIIILDEEHDSSYKSWTSPKYDTREIAKKRIEIHNGKLLMGSATPSVESYYRAQKGKIKYLEMNKRADGASLPKITLVDMKKELENGNTNMFSRVLYESIKENLENKEQTIIFLNRRGYSGFVSCRKCGFVYKCSNCDISLNYHIGSNRLTCHYCGYTTIPSKMCPSCNSKYIKLFSAGTEKVERQLNINFPYAKVMRMDFDTTRKKGEFEEIYKKFKNREGDILVGTQMVSKGLDFSNVTLVGVVSADISLNIPDFKSHERTFQLLTQVSGRSGRGKKNGKVIIQTYQADDFSINRVINNDTYGFYEEEIESRKLLNYPPFSKLLLIGMSSENENKLKEFAEKISNEIKKMISCEEDIKILGPTQSLVGRINKKWRWQIMLKGSISLELMMNIKIKVYDMIKEVYNIIKVSLDINPNNMI